MLDYQSPEMMQRLYQQRVMEVQSLQEENLTQIMMILKLMYLEMKDKSGML